MVPRMSGDFEGRHVVVTGGTGALGSAVVGELLQRGARVHIPVFAPKELDHFPHRTNDRVTVRAGLDFTVEETIDRYYGALESLWGSIHLAGGFGMTKLTDTKLDEFLRLMNMNAVTCFLACREATKAIRKSGKGGRIVNVAAKPALNPASGAGMAAYTASKSVVASLTQSLSEELAPEGIWVNAVAPSIMDTPFNRSSMPGADYSKWPKVEEVGATIVHLASPTNGVARGAIVPVFGKS
jgi:NAD(P)-dependent dehydrogenase (short-subunit alcohol dehydrogenase family)